MLLESKRERERERGGSCIIIKTINNDNISKRNCENKLIFFYISSILLL